MTRVFVCLLLFGWGAEALGGGTFAVIVSGAIALGASHLWKRADRERQEDAHRRQVIADATLRAEAWEQAARRGQARQ